MSTLTFCIFIYISYNDKNIFKIIKLLNQAKLLYLPDEGSSQSDTNQICISSAQAIQLVWKSAFMSKQLGIVQQQIINDQMINESHILDDLLAGFQQKLSHITKKRKKAQLNQLISSFVELKNQVEQLKHELNIQKFNKSTQQQNRFVSLTKTNFQSADLQIILSALKRAIVRTDIKILQNSILFIQQMQTQQCLVSLEHMYPSFTINKAQLMLIIGKQYYNRALNRYQYFYQRAKQKKIEFSPKKYIMCHKCDSCRLLQIQQIGQNQKQSICKLINQPLSYTQTAFVYQQRFLFSKFQMDSGKINQKEYEQDSLKNYAHPYIKSHIQKCNRYVCKECSAKRQKQAQLDLGPQKQIAQVLLSQQKAQIHQFKCQFCLRSCCCIRCRALVTLNKLVAIYDAMGGNFQQLSQEMVFLNFNHPTIKMEQVQFDSSLHKHIEKEQPIAEPKVQVKRKRGRPKKIHKEQKPQRKKRQRKIKEPKQPKTKKNKMKRMAFKVNNQGEPQDIPQEQYYQQSINQNEDSNQQESIDSKQIFPKLQDLFTSILQQEDKTFNYDQTGNQTNTEDNNEQQKIKVGQEPINQALSTGHNLINQNTQRANQNLSGENCL